MISLQGKTCVVLGAAGQDGILLCARLVEAGCNVVALCRQVPVTPRIIESDQITYIECDLAIARVVGDVLSQHMPDLIFHFAAVHGPSGTVYEEIWDSMLAVNTRSVHEILEYMRVQKPDSWLFYASSARVFGPLEGEIDELSPQVGNDLYAITKKASGNLIEYYRATHDIKATTGFLFQHDSQFRVDGYFIPKIVEILKGSLSDPTYKGEVFTLEFEVDVGSADEYMSLAIDLAVRQKSLDVVLATGKTVNVRTMVNELFRHYGLDYRNHVVEKVVDTRPKTSFKCNIARLEIALDGRRPSKGFVDICEDILSSQDHEFARSNA